MGWVTIAPSARVTFYGPRFVPGMACASGEPYQFGPVAALGPTLLQEARRISGRVWGMQIRITDRETGRQAIFRVVDTGSPRLEVDLPDPIWAERFGHPLDQGLFYGRVEVWGSRP